MTRKLDIHDKFAILLVIFVLVFFSAINLVKGAVNPPLPTPTSAPCPLPGYCLDYQVYLPVIPLDWCHGGHPSDCG